MRSRPSRAGNAALLRAAFLVAPAAAVLAVGSAPAQEREERPPRARHVVLISVDGLRPDFYLDERWPAPTLQRIRREGAYAEAVRSVFPSVTYPSHTTIVTGALPARHGVVYNEPFDPSGRTGRWYWEADSILVATLWEAVRADGGTTAAVSWPVTVNAPIDWNVAEIWPFEEERDLVAVQRAASRPEGLWDELEREAVGRVRSEMYGVGTLSRDDYVSGMAGYLLERYRPTLLAVHLIGTDHFQHERGRSHIEVSQAVGAVDRGIGRILEAAARANLLPQTAVIVTGDHGFVDTHTRIAPNVWLARAGLRDSTADRGNWRATFHAMAGSAFLHLRDPDDGAAVDSVRRLLESLPRGQRRLFRVIELQELAEMGAAPDARLALTAAPGIAFTESAVGQALVRSPGATHGYDPELEDNRTGFVAWGAGIPRGVVVPVMGLEDIAPLIAGLLGIPFEAADGVLYPGLIDDQ